MEKLLGKDTLPVKPMKVIQRLLKCQLSLKTMETEGKDMFTKPKFLGNPIIAAVPNDSINKTLRDIWTATAQTRSEESHRALIEHYTITSKNQLDLIFNWAKNGADIDSLKSAWKLAKNWTVDNSSKLSQEVLCKCWILTRNSWIMGNGKSSNSLLSYNALNEIREEKLNPLKLSEIQHTSLGIPDTKIQEHIPEPTDIGVGPGVSNQDQSLDSKGSTSGDQQTQANTPTTRAPLDFNPVQKQIESADSKTEISDLISKKIKVQKYPTKQFGTTTLQSITPMQSSPKKPIESTDSKTADLQPVVKNALDQKDPIKIPITTNIQPKTSLDSSPVQQIEPTDSKTGQSDSPSKKVTERNYLTQSLGSPVFQDMESTPSASTPSDQQPPASTISPRTNSDDNSKLGFNARQHPGSTGVKGSSNALSNFASIPIVVNGVTYHTGEQYYQCRKAEFFGLSYIIYKLRSKKLGHQVKTEGDKFMKGQALRKLRTRPGFKQLETIWQEIEATRTVRHILQFKYDQSQSFRATLHRTGNRYIFHHVSSPTWGTGSNVNHPLGGQGQNTFGKELMALREKELGVPIARKPTTEETTQENHTIHPFFLDTSSTYYNDPSLLRGKLKDNETTVGKKTEHPTRKRQLPTQTSSSLNSDLDTGTPIISNQGQQRPSTKEQIQPLMSLRTSFAPTSSLNEGTAHSQPSWLAEITPPPKPQRPPKAPRRTLQNKTSSPEQTTTDTLAIASDENNNMHQTRITGFKMEEPVHKQIKMNLPTATITQAATVEDHHVRHQTRTTGFQNRNFTYPKQNKTVAPVLSRASPGPSTGTEKTVYTQNQDQPEQTIVPVHQRVRNDPCTGTVNIVKAFKTGDHLEPPNKRPKLMGFTPFMGRLKDTDYVLPTEKMGLTRIYPERATPSGKYLDKGKIWQPPNLSSFITLVGDSNLDRISHIPSPFAKDTTIFSYPGLRFDHIAQLYSKTNRQYTAEHVVVSVGINNRAQEWAAPFKDQVLTGLQTISSRYPHATIYIPRLPHKLQDPKHQSNIKNLEKGLEEAGYIMLEAPKSLEFSTDGIHLNPKSANTLLEHWLQQLDVGELLRAKNRK